LHIIAEHGEAWIRFPNRLRWRQRRRSVQERIRSRWTVEAKLLREFRQFCQNQSPPSSDLTMARICAEIWKRI
jgi:hypothetical protein